MSAFMTLSTHISLYVCVRVLYNSVLNNIQKWSTQTKHSHWTKICFCRSADRQRHRGLTYWFKPTVWWLRVLTLRSDRWSDRGFSCLCVCLTCLLGAFSSPVEAAESHLWALSSPELVSCSADRQVGFVWWVEIDRLKGLQTDDENNHNRECSKIINTIYVH